MTPMIIPENLFYTEEHEWLNVLEDGVAIIGITDFAQQQLGDLVFVELPEVGDHIIAGDEFGSVESVKASSELYSPVSGEVLEVNTELANSPENVNSSPYSEGWLVRVRMEDNTELHGLMDAEAYGFHIQRASQDEEDPLEMDDEGLLQGDKD